MGSKELGMTEQLSMHTQGSYKSAQHISGQEVILTYARALCTSPLPGPALETQ